MPFLDKTGLAYLWQQIIARLNNKVEKEELDEAIAGAAPAYTYGTEDLEAGVSPLETGTLYFVYE